MAQKQPQLTLAQAHQHYLNYIALARAGRDADGMASLALAGEAAHPGALFSLASMELQGLDGERHVKSASAKLVAAAKQGHSRARQTLAVMRALGIGRAANWAEAVALVVQSARSGDVGAMRELGLLLEMAHPGHPLAADLLLRAARAEDVLAVLAVVTRAHAGKCEMPAQEIAFWTHALQRVKHPRAMRLPRVEAPPAQRTPVAMPALEEHIWTEIGALLGRMPGDEAPAAGKRISSEPSIFEFKNLLSEEECDFLIGLAGPLLTHASVYNPITGTTQMNSVRTASEAPFWLTNKA